MKNRSPYKPIPWTRMAVLFSAFALLICTAAEEETTPAEGGANSVNSWGKYGGPTGNFHYIGLPEKLLDEPEMLWQAPVKGKTYAPISADENIVIVPDHDDAKDYFQAFDPETGDLLWTHEIENGREMDFGASPRAMPILYKDSVIVYNAWGIVQALNRADGSVIWEVDTVAEFGAEIPVWGYCSTPRMIEQGILFNPGGSEGGLVCLNPDTGETVWTAASEEANYAAHFVGEIQGKPQVLFYDIETLRSVDPATGEELWNLEVYASSGYICPKPVVTDSGKLLLIDQDNGARLYEMNDGTIGDLAAESWDIYSELNTPILYKGKAYFFFYEMIAADADTLEITYRNAEHTPFAATAFAYTFLDPEASRMLVFTGDGSLTLMDLKGEEPVILQSVKVAADSENCPALIGNILYVRDDYESVYAYRLW